MERDSKTQLPTKRAVQEATNRVKKAGYDLDRAVVITEAEHDNDYVMQSDNEIVFVLPNKSRVAARRRPPSRHGQIADGLYAERNLHLATTQFKASDAS